jgi:hypothetical protein
MQEQSDGLELVSLAQAPPGATRAGPTSTHVTRAELFWLAYLWWCNDCWERQVAAFHRAVFKAYENPGRIAELSMRESPLWRRMRTSTV